MPCITQTCSETGTEYSYTLVDECEGHKKENEGLEIEETEPIKTVIEKEYLFGDKPERVWMHALMKIYCGTLLLFPRNSY